jgi:hypothetical protein
MKAHVLAIPLLFSSFAACTVPTDADDGDGVRSAQRAKEEIDRDRPGGGGGPDDPGGSDDPRTCGRATGSVSVTPAWVKPGESATVSWSVTLPRGCDIGPTLNGRTVGVSGSETVKPIASQPFVLMLNGKVVARTSVNVVLPSTVRITANTVEQRDLLAQAVGTPNTRVVLAPGVDLNMTGREDIRVATGVTLTREKPAQWFTQVLTFQRGDFVLPTQIGRDARTPGPRLYTTGRPKPLFRVHCPVANMDANVRFEGFRLQGPHYDSMEGDENLERGIEIDNCANVEISNMELSGFSGTAVYVHGIDGLQVGPAVRVRDSYIHNNQHVGGNGYGVDVGPGASVHIERNVFDFNRHAIAASGKVGTTYVAAHNLVLAGGGQHDKWYNHYTHQFDIHGDDNCPSWIPGSWDEHIWNCGRAGDGAVFRDNAFQYANDHAIKIRGVPRRGVNFYGNVFPHATVSSDFVLGADGKFVRVRKAIQTYGDENVIMGPNEAGFDSYGKYGVCDFDGDGKDDLFLATGASWWFSSGGEHHWVYLSPNRERLSEIALGDFDGDKRCDVFHVDEATSTWRLWKGGTGAWSELPYAVPFDQLRFGDFNGDKITDVFRAAPGGQWWAVSPGIYDWKRLQSSSISVSAFRFGDFDGDGITDVLKRGSAGYEISSGAVSSWTPWGSQKADPTGFLVADVDGLPGDDLVRYVSTGSSSGRWEVSSQGRNAFATLATAPAGDGLGFVGRFKGGAKADLIGVNASRMGQILSAGSKSFAPHGRHPY